MGYYVSFWHENLLLCILYHFDIVRNLGMCRCGRIILVSILPKESNLEVVGGLTPYSSSISTPLSFLLVFPFLLPCLQWSSWTVRGAPAPLNLPLIIDCCVHVLVVLLTTRSLHSYIHFRLIQAIGTALAKKLMHEVANVGWGIAPSSHIRRPVNSYLRGRCVSLLTVFVQPWSEGKHKFCCIYWLTASTSPTSALFSSSVLECTARLNHNAHIFWFCPISFVL